MEQYGDDPCTNFLPTHVTDCVAENSDVTAKLLKAITVIQFKLEGQLILRHPEYKMDGRLLLGELVLNAGKALRLDLHLKAGLLGRLGELVGGKVGVSGTDRARAHGYDLLGHDHHSFLDRAPGGVLGFPCL